MRKAKEFFRTFGAILISLAFFFVLFLVLDFHWAIALALAIGMYFGAYFFLKPTAKIGNTDVDTMINGERNLTMMEGAEEDLKSMAGQVEKISSTEVQNHCKALIVTGNKILDYLTAHPDKIPDASQFCNYYLDMAQKLEDRYIYFQNAGIPAETTGSEGNVMQQTADALGLLNTAFEKQYARLAEGEVMEVESDIRVLEKMVEMEGDS